MSGGSYDYKYYVLKDYYVGRMYDVELNEMMKDLIDVLYAVEWWQSGDIDENDYRKTVENFKKKWFKRRKIDIQKLINEQFEEKRNELYENLKYLTN